MKRPKNVKVSTYQPFKDGVFNPHWPAGYNFLLGYPDKGLNIPKKPVNENISVIN